MGTPGEDLPVLSVRGIVAEVPFLISSMGTISTDCRGQGACQGQVLVWLLAEVIPVRCTVIPNTSCRVVASSTLVPLPTWAKTSHLDGAQQRRTGCDVHGG